MGQVAQQLKVLADSEGVAIVFPSDGTKSGAAAGPQVVTDLRGNYQLNHFATTILGMHTRRPENPSDPRSAALALAGDDEGRADAILRAMPPWWERWTATDEARRFGPRPIGRFLVSTGEIADLRGWPRLSGGRASAGGITYGRPMTEFRGHVRTLEGYGIKGTSEIKARSVEPLIQFYEHNSGGTYYRHAPILIDTILAQAGKQEPGGFAQVPVRALRLGARDGAAIYGLSAFWRRGAATEWQGTLRELATEIGSFSPNEARKRGRAYWLDLASELARIVRDGGFGALHVGGADPGPDAPCTLTPSPDLESAYQRLHEARERARAKTESVEHEAAVRRKLPPARRRPRRPGS